MNNLRKKVKIGCVAMTLVGGNLASACVITSIQPAEWTCGGRAGHTTNIFTQRAHALKSVAATDSAIVGAAVAPTLKLDDSEVVEGETNSVVATHSDNRPFGNRLDNRFDNGGQHSFGCGLVSFGCFSEYNAAPARMAAAADGINLGTNEAQLAITDGEQIRDAGSIVDFHNAAGNGSAGNEFDGLYLKTEAPVLSRIELGAVAVTTETAAHSVAVPEPSNIGLLGAGIIFLLAARKHSKASGLLRAVH